MPDFFVINGSKSSPELFAPILAFLEANQASLLADLHEILWKLRFSNKTTIRPKNLIFIAQDEVNFSIRFFKNPDLDLMDHGVFLQTLGLSSQSFFGIMDVYQRFFLPVLKDNFDLSEWIYPLIQKMTEGFFNSYTLQVRTEQENFRMAFQISQNKNIEDIKAAREAIQRTNEESYRNIILAQEDERRRISRELHDEAGQALIGIRMSLENLIDPKRNDKITFSDRIASLIDSTNNALEEIRTLSYRLRPPILDLMGIHMTIKQLCLDFSDQARLEISYQGIELPRISDELAISIYRVVQEALTNVAKHAHATRVWVELNAKDNQIQLNIKDDGIGFDPENVVQGIGLTGMRERVRLLNGKMSYENLRGKYFMLKFLFPYSMDKDGKQTDGIEPSSM